MKVEQLLFTPAQEWCPHHGSLAGVAPQFVLVFGERALLTAPNLAGLRARFPSARLVCCSTAGEIVGTEVHVGSLTATAVAFERSEVRCLSTTIAQPSDSRACGAHLGRELARPDLAHVFVLCDGAITNGSEFVAGLVAHLPAAVKVTGGLAGDGDRFEKTLVGLDELPTDGRIVALGFYGTQLRVHYGCEGGWSSFGPERIVTRSVGNQLFELDGRSALDLYKSYLGDQARGLPGTAFRFPLSVHPIGAAAPVVRTILSIDDAAPSMTFAGDIPMGARVRFMRASYEDIIDGAARAATAARGDEPELVLCVSCIGRRIVLGQRTEEETELVRDAVGTRSVITGFYSYGELAPQGDGACQLHNQTMTITSLSEA
ncbi:MAG: FIST C-terminal domain-containing protein [Opitutae bacterium]|nr:FIST C-terminal domain-containing protein [Opitutae bacterium]